MKVPPIREPSQIKSLEAPYEILEGADRAKIDSFCAGADQFVIAWTTVRPFERMQFLLGTENLFIELAGGTKEIKGLRDVLHDFFMEELSWWAKTGVEGIMFMDDWGSQNSLLISKNNNRTQISLEKPLLELQNTRLILMNV